MHPEMNTERDNPENVECMKSNEGRISKKGEFKYILVRRKYWTQEELDELNIRFTGVAKYLFGDER